MTDAELLSAIHSGKLVVVPREPTPDMVNALDGIAWDVVEQGHVYDEYDSDPAKLVDNAAQLIWEVMLSAAPGVALEATREDNSSQGMLK